MVTNLVLFIIILIYFAAVSVAIAFKEFAHLEILKSCLSLSTNASVNAIPNPKLVKTRCIAKESNKRLNITMLMLSDSIGRLLVDDWCHYQNSKSKEWGDFKYKASSAASQVCVVGKITLGFVHLYGSDPIGPYVGVDNFIITNTNEDPYTDTNLRIKHAIEIFSQQFGIPNFILIRNDLWDIIKQPIPMRNTHDHSDLMEKYLHNYKLNIAEIREILPSVHIGTHTIPTPTWGGILFQKYENMLRLLSASSSNSIYLLDWQLLTPNSPDNGNSFHLRDGHHPKMNRIIVFANLMFRIIEDFLNVTC